ncbi:hypothetical protein K435DRAFT_877552 [Dendrothele bispora CBS 962.96]|uniref:Uncharacterized protein n=1 Tax=Dendrothele bispora (strain CBS 962.96) TaxID=1314807 RepID=A0A4S8KPN5_DENBC|nr:hypothetical protein K435DRAFT_877552 [Dendrothele bispora CBS 962.96]
MSTVWLMVDDTDSRLSYQGAWTPMTLNTTQAEKYQQLSNGLLPNGPVFDNTLHETRSNVSVSFSFNGKFLHIASLSFSEFEVGSSFLITRTIISSVLKKTETHRSTAHSMVGSDEVANFLNFPTVGQGPVNNVLFCVIQGSSTINGKDSKFQPGEHELQINVTNPNGTMGWFFDYINV